MMSGNYLPKTFWASLTIGGGLLLLLPRPNSRLRISPLGAVWVLYLAWALISLAWAPSPRPGLERWGAVFLPTCGYLLAARTRFWENRACWGAFSILVGIVAGIGILQYMYEELPLIHWFQGTAVPRSTMGQRNYASMYLMLAIPFLFYAWFKLRRAMAFVALAAALLGGIFLLLAKTRGALVGCGLGLFFILAAGGLKKVRQEPKKLRVLLVLPILVAALALVVQPSPKVRESIGRKRNLAQVFPTILNPAQRLDFWRPCLGVTDFWRGAGFGNFPVVATPSTAQGLVKTLNWEVHNDYLQAFVDLGLVGFLLFAAACGLLLRGAWRGRNTGTGLAAGAAAIGMLFMQFTTFTSEKVSSLIWFAGIAAVINTPERKHPLLSLPVWPGFSRLASRLAGLLLLFLAAAAALAIRSDRRFRQISEEAAEAAAMGHAAGEESSPQKKQRIYLLYRQRREIVMAELDDLRENYLPWSWFDANMRHISLHQLAEISMDLGDAYHADFFSREALRLHPHDRTCITFLAYNALREGRTVDAEHWLERGMQVFGCDPYLPFFCEKLAAVLEKRGDTKRARSIRSRQAANFVRVPASPQPPDWTAGVEPETNLSWGREANRSYDVYFWERGGPQPRSPALAVEGFDPVRPPIPLEPGKVYLWRVTAQGTFGSATGPIWSFRVGPVALDREQPLD